MWAASLVSKKVPRRAHGVIQTNPTYSGWIMRIRQNKDDDCGERNDFTGGLKPTATSLTNKCERKNVSGL